MRVLYVTFGIVVVDQITKILVKGFSVPLLGIYWEGMYLGQSIPIVGDFLRLTYIENPGMAFGIDIGGKPFFAIFSIAACVGIFWYLYTIRRERFIVRLPLAMILGGAIGNLIDRVFYGVLYSEAPMFQGSVVDFIDVIFFNVTIFGYNLSRWPVFNIADSAVTIGVILLIIFHRKSIDENKSIKPQENKESNSNSSKNDVDRARAVDEEGTSNTSTNQNIKA